MSDKIYCGNGKEKVFNDGGSLISVLLDVDVLAENFKEHGFTTTAGKRKIRIDVCKGREVDQYGNTHYTTIDVFKPDANYSKKTQTEKVAGVFQDDIPF